MKVFENQHRLGNDDCSKTAKDYQNSSINDYYLWNTYVNKCDTDADHKIQDFAIENTNLWYRNGYGYTNGCHVDDDTEVRNNAKITHEKAKIQLFTRFYQANPDLSRGIVTPNLESRLVQGADTTALRQCDRVSEKNYDRFTPLIPCLKDNVQNPNNIVMQGVWGGENSRNVMRDAENLRRCGHVNDGKTWKRANN